MNSAASGAAVCRAPLGVVDGAALFGTRGFLGGFSACDLGRLPPPFAPPPRPFGVGAAASLVCACDLALSPLPLVSPTLPFVTGAAASSVSAFDLVFLPLPFVPLPRPFGAGAALSVPAPPDCLSPAPAEICGSGVGAATLGRFTSG